MLKKKKEAQDGLNFVRGVVHLIIEEENSLTFEEVKGGGSSREELTEVIRKKE